MTPRVALGLAFLTAGGVAFAEPPALNLLSSPETAIAALRERFPGGTRVLSLNLRPDSLDVEAQDPAVRAHVDRVTFEDGAFGDPEPVPVGRNQRRLEAQLFPLDDVDLSLLPRLVAHAERRAETEGGRAMHVRVERQEGGGDVPSWGRPLVRVYVEGPRGGAYVEFALDGKEKDVKRW